jgi:hypothetical protein
MFYLSVLDTIFAKRQQKLLELTKLILPLIKKMIMENQNPENQLNIELSEEIAEGIYSNLAIITHSPTEFVVDFIKVMPGVPKAKVKSRIVLTPQHAKRLMKALADNVTRFEQMHGKIKDSEMNALPLNFGGPTAQA